MVFIKKYFLNFMALLMVLFGSTGCNTEVTEPIIQNINFFSTSTLADIEVIENSTNKSQPRCERNNRVVVQVSLPKNNEYYCSDQSKLMETVRRGETCSGGVSVLDFPVDAGAVPCDRFTLCGMAPTRKETIEERFDGGKIENWTFENLPWGCEINLVYDVLENFNVQASPKVKDEIIPPGCPFCVTSNEETCLPCEELRDDQTVLGGQVIFTECNGQNCADCTIGDNRTVPHGTGVPFYRQRIGECGSRCVTQSQLRVCNNGFFEGDPGFGFSQCTDALCGCRLPGDETLYDSGTIITLYPGVMSECGQACQAFPIRCDDGVWLKTQDSQPVTTAEFQANPSRRCSRQQCDCPRPNRSTVMENTTVPVFSRPTVSCTESCGTYQGAVTCSAGRLTSNIAAHLTYTHDSCTQQDCGCTIDLPQGGAIRMDNNTTKTLFAFEENTPQNLQACTNPADQQLYTCNNTVVSPAYNPRFRYEACQEQGFPCTFPGTPEVTVEHNRTMRVYQESNPTCDGNCSFETVRCVNGTFTRTNHTALPADYFDTWVSSQCTPSDCDCQFNGTPIPHNSSRQFFSQNQGSCAANSCAAFATTISCVAGVIQEPTDPNAYPFPSCSPMACGCATPWGATIPNNSSRRAYRMETTTCEERTACTEPSNYTDVTCTDGVLGTYDNATFQYGSCQAPSCTCRHAGQTMEFGAIVYFYSTNRPPEDQSCGENMAEFQCTNDGLLVPTQSSNELTNYPHATCESLYDEGSLGGTGGGGGNDEGPGWALRPRSAGNDGCEATESDPFLCAGTPCLDGVQCRVEGISTPITSHTRQSCELPWGEGEIEYYGSILAFSRRCVVPPDRCTNYRQSRTCTFGGMTGDDSFQFETCEESPTCP